jgi:hypothetical protein
MRAIGLSGVFRGFAMRCSPVGATPFHGATSCNSSVPLVAEPCLSSYISSGCATVMAFEASISASSVGSIYFGERSSLIALLIASPPAFHTARLYGGYLAFRIFVFRAGIDFVSNRFPLVILTSIIVYMCRERFRAWLPLARQIRRDRNLLSFARKVGLLTALRSSAKFALFAPVAQLDRASDYGSEGLRFESPRARVTRNKDAPART